MTAYHHRDQIKWYLKDQFNLPEDQIDSMIPGFLNTLNSHLTKLEEALRQQDPYLLGRAGHTMKGALLNLGLHDTATIAFTIEQKGKAGEAGTDFEGLVTSLRARLDSLLG